MSTVSKLRVADMIFPLREFAQIDSHVAYHLWVLIFPIVWATLQKEEQLQLAEERLLQGEEREYDDESGEGSNGGGVGCGIGGEAASGASAIRGEAGASGAALGARRHQRRGGIGGGIGGEAASGAASRARRHWVRHRGRGSIGDFGDYYYTCTTRRDYYYFYSSSYYYYYYYHYYFYYYY